MSAWKTVRHICYGFLAGTAGVRILSSKDAKKVYTHLTAAIMRGVDDVMATVENVKENCMDIAEDARAINDKRYAEEEEQLIKDAREIIAEAEESEAAETDGE